MSEALSSRLSVALVDGAQALGLALSSEMRAQLLGYVALIERWNKVYNLTAVRDPQDMLTQHLLDCLTVVDPFRRCLGELTHPSVLDVGSGAGLPGVVLAIVNPTWQITCVDTVAKKASFIRQVGVELGLPNLTAIHKRVEDMSGQVFDLVTSRAFASLQDFVSLTQERLASGGVWAAMKAHLTEEERCAVLASVFHVEPLTVPGLEAERCLVWMRPVDAA